MAKRDQKGSLEGDSQVMVNLKELEERWQVARATYEHANSLAVQAVTKYVEVGLHLVGIRQQYAGDLEFGRARQEWFPEMSKSWCSRLMKVARDPRLHTQELSSLSISHLVELSSKDNETIEQIAQSVDEGQQVSVRDIKKAGRGGSPDDAPPVDADPTPTDTSAPASEPEDGPTEPAPEDVDADGYRWEEPPEIESAPRKPMEEQIQEALQMSVMDRINYVRERPWGSPDNWIILGLPPFTDSLPNMELVEVAAEYWKEGMDSNTQDVIEDAMHRVLEEYNE